MSRTIFPAHPAVWRFYLLPVMCCLLVSFGGCGAQTVGDLGLGEAGPNGRSAGPSGETLSAEDLAGLKKAFAEAEKLAVASASGAAVEKAYRDVVRKCGAALKNGANAEVLAIRARCFLRLKDNAAANRDVAAALERDPNLADAYATRARLEHVSGQPVAALADYDEAIALDARCAFALNNRSIFYQQAGRLAEARADLETLLNAHPRHYKGFYNLGLVWRALGNVEASVSAYSQSLDIHPRFRSALKGRGNALTELGRYDEALQDYSDALAISPQNAALYTARAAARVRKSLTNLEQQGLAEVAEPRRAERDAVLADLDAALRLKPNDIGVRLQHALLQRGAGDLETALADFTFVLSLDAKHDAALVQRGVTYQIAGKPAEALEDYSRAIALQPDNIGYQDLRAELKLEQGADATTTEDIGAGRSIEAALGKQPANSRQ